MSNIVLFSRSRTLAYVATLVMATTLGVLAPLLVDVGGPVIHATHLILSAGCTWAALAFCAGLGRSRKIDSAVVATIALLAAVIAYYLTKLGQGEFITADLSDPTGRTTQTSWASFFSNSAIWCIAACFFGPILGLAGNLARQHGFRGLLFRAVIPAMAIIETSERIRVEASLQGDVADTTWSAIRLLAVAVLIVLVGKTVITSRSRHPVRL